MEDHNILRVHSRIPDLVLLIFNWILSLKCGDVIWLHHSETNTTIAAARKGKAIDKNSFSDFNLMEWMSDVNLELKIVKGDTKENYEEYIGDTYSMWIIESEDQR